MLGPLSADDCRISFGGSKHPANSQSRRCVQIWLSDRASSTLALSRDAPPPVTTASPPSPKVAAARELQQQPGHRPRGMRRACLLHSRLLHTCMVLLIPHRFALRARSCAHSFFANRVSLKAENTGLTTMCLTLSVPLLAHSSALPPLPRVPPAFPSRVSLPRVPPSLSLVAPCLSSRSISTPRRPPHPRSRLSFLRVVCCCTLRVPGCLAPGPCRSWADNNRATRHLFKCSFPNALEVACEEVCEFPEHFDQPLLRKTRCGPDLALLGLSWSDFGQVRAFQGCPEVGQVGRSGPEPGMLLHIGSGEGEAPPHSAALGLRRRQELWGRSAEIASRRDCVERARPSGGTPPDGIAHSRGVSGPSADPRVMVRPLRLCDLHEARSDLVKVAARCPLEQACVPGDDAACSKARSPNKRGEVIRLRHELV